MALSQRHRSTIYQKLAPVIGAEEAEALLSEFPSNDLDTPATKEFVRAEMGELRAEMGELRADIADRMRQQTIWIVSAMASAIAVGMGVAAGIGRL